MYTYVVFFFLQVLNTGPTLRNETKGSLRGSLMGNKRRGWVLLLWGQIRIL
jgi:hypothetical protein